MEKKELLLDYQIEEFLLYCKSKELRPKTLKSYEQTLRLFERWINDNYQIYYVNEVKENILRKYVLDIQDRGKYTFVTNDKQKKTNYPERRRDFRKPIDNTSINNYIRNLKVFFNWLFMNDTIIKNPVKSIKQLSDSRKTKDFISDDEFIKLIRILDKSYFSEHRDYVMIILMFDTGMRLGECSMLLIEDIDLAHKQIRLKAEITKGRKDRTVYFSAKTERVVRRWIQYKDRYNDSEYLFPSLKGGHVSVQGFETNFTRYIHRIGLTKKLSPHCLRNNFAKRCLMNGMDIYTLSRILGHSSVKVTEQAYLDLTEEDLGKKYRMYSPIENI